jgi:predicted ArsR family transcriptional regulator
MTRQTARQRRHHAYRTVLDVLHPEIAWSLEELAYVAGIRPDALRRLLLRIELDGELERVPSKRGTGGGSGRGRYLYRLAMRRAA